MKRKNTSRISAAFEALKEKKEKALITFITAGDPDIKTTKDLVLTLEGSGADIIELGIPFSDPMADGPTIQASSERAIAAGTTIQKVIALVKDVRKESSVPIVLFGYYNPIFTFGLKRFARGAKEAGVDGVLVVDLPPEESDELKKELDGVGIDLIFLLTPTSDRSRMRLVASKGSGFIYFVSVTGVTGARKEVSKNIRDYIKEARKHTGLPLGVGFGISTPAQAREVCQWADGVIVGSAIINIVSKTRGGKKTASEVGRFVSRLKKGISGGNFL